MRERKASRLNELDRNLPILFVGSYAEPEPIGGNRTLSLQAVNLRALGIPAEIFTWPINDTWRGPVPNVSSLRLAGQPYLHVERWGIPYHVASLPKIWSERILAEKEWGAAVAWGMQALSELRPRLVHQQFWQNLWWMMEAAIRLGIPVAYSAHDYGIACLRTILVNGWDTLCDGVVAVSKCSRCILAGRNLLGKANEWVASLPLADRLLSLAFGSNADGPLARAGGVRLPVKERVALTIKRCRRVFNQLDALIVTTPFARDFFIQFGTPSDRIHIMPWFHAQDLLLQELPKNWDSLCIGLITRISPEKGVHIVLEALRQVKASKPILLKIAGSPDNAYAQDLMRRFPESSGNNRVQWCGWISGERLPDFYKDVHVVAVPSLWYDNAPLAMIEALAHGRPVICSDVPSMTHLVQHEVNGLVFPMGDTVALAHQIERLAGSPELVRQLAKRTRNVMSAIEYAKRLGSVYQAILKIR